MNGRRTLRRPKEGRLIAGVCAGVADRLGWNRTVLRVLWLLIALIPILPGLPAYLVCWLLIRSE